MSAQPLEHRLRPRIDINSMIGIQLEGSNKMERAELDNLSEGGASIWTRHELSIGSKMLCIADPGDEQEDPIEFSATVVRIENAKRGPLHGYGCVIELLRAPE